MRPYIRDRGSRQSAAGNAAVRRRHGDVVVPWRPLVRQAPDRRSPRSGHHIWVVETPAAPRTFGGPLRALASSVSRYRGFTLARGVLTVRVRAPAKPARFRLSGRLGGGRRGPLRLSRGAKPPPSLELRYHPLMPAVVGVRLLAVEAQRFDHRPILDREQHGVVAAR